MGMSSSMPEFKDPITGEATVYKSIQFSGTREPINVAGTQIICHPKLETNEINTPIRLMLCLDITEDDHTLLVIKSMLGKIETLLNQQLLIIVSSNIVNKSSELHRTGTRDFSQTISTAKALLEEENEVGWIVVITNKHHTFEVENSNPNIQIISVGIGDDYNLGWMQKIGYYVHVPQLKSLLIVLANITKEVQNTWAINASLDFAGSDLKDLCGTARLGPLYFGRKIIVAMQFKTFEKLTISYTLVDTKQRVSLEIDSSRILSNCLLEEPFLRECYRFRNFQLQYLVATLKCSVEEASEEMKGWVVVKESISTQKSIKDSVSQFNQIRMQRVLIDTHTMEVKRCFSNT